MLGADAALTRHGRRQAWQRWIDAKASSSFSQWDVALMRHDKIGTGPENYRYSGWLRGHATNTICSSGDPRLEIRQRYVPVSFCVAALDDFHNWLCLGLQPAKANERR